MPVVYLKKKQNVKYENASGVTLVFSPVDTIEADAAKSAVWGAIRRNASGAAELDFEAMHAIGMSPISVAANHLLKIEKITVDDCENAQDIEADTLTIDERKNILLQLIACEGFGDLHEFLKRLADGQKKTLLTT